MAGIAATHKSNIATGVSCTAAEAISARPRAEGGEAFDLSGKALFLYKTHVHSFVSSSLRSAALTASASLSCAVIFTHSFYRYFTAKNIFYCFFYCFII